jgi:hypothetical protein
MLFYTKLRKKTIFPLSMVRDLTIYLTPNQDDFEMLKKTSQEGRTSMSGKKNKYDAKHSSKKAKFPLRSMGMGEELLKYCNESFETFDFVYMLFHIVATLFLAISLTNVLAELVAGESISMNLTFYLGVFTIAYYWSMLSKGLFKTGWNLSDEAKVQVLFALKSFVMVWAAFTYSEGGFSSFIGLKVD